MKEPKPTSTDPRFDLSISSCFQSNGDRADLKTQQQA